MDSDHFHCVSRGQLAADVHQAFLEYSFEQLEKMWQHKSYIMGAVLTTAPKVGGSNSPRHDPSKKLKFSTCVERCVC